MSLTIHPGILNGRPQLSASENWLKIDRSTPRRRSEISHFASDGRGSKDSLSGLQGLFVPK